jgi:CRISPR/Cas system endoribonuclease Cas6 (RAMP superfamily)
MLTLCSLYGKVEDFEIKGDVSSIAMTNQNIKWEDQSHYSARQKKAMKLGGCVGDFTLSGSFSGRELALLEFAELFQAGKNTNFGLGKIDCWKK